jgi:Tat protein secretion system quality control protein TatD with DNase activity
MREKWGEQLIDSHVHLNRQELLPDNAEVLARARAGGVTAFLNVGYDLVTSRESIALATQNPDILATVGIHPHDALMLADETGQLPKTETRPWMTWKKWRPTPE